MPFPLRQKRVADRIQAEISDLIQLEMNDPRLSLVTVTRVIIDRELEHANIFVSTVGDEERRQEVMRVLSGAKGFMRREIGRRVRLRRTPELLFHWDPSPEKAEQIVQLLDELKDTGAQDDTQPAPHEAVPPAEEDESDRDDLR